ncbi:MAG: biopolymer transporter ExbD [Verrucomicrobiales bacterium]|nr:biopolymer transporter ExbD [Verrucomicrobiales bacterium]
MLFYTKKRSRPVVPIISLIDILAILLIYFIVTTTARKKKNLLSIDLPRAEHLKALVTQDNRATISVTKEGEIYLEDETVTLETLAAVLAQFKAESPDAKIELKADEKTDLGTLVSIWDAITQSGFKIKDVPARLQVTPPPTN